MNRHRRDTQLYLRLLRYVAPYWRMFVIAIFGMILLAATEPLLASLMKPLLDGAFIENDPDTMFWVPILLVALFFIRGVASYISASAMLWVSNKVITDLRSQMFSRLISFPSEYYDNHLSGSLMSLFTYDVTQIKQASANAITTIVRDSLTVFGLLGFMVYVNWQLTIIALIATPFITFIILLIRNRLRKMSRKAQDSMGDIHHILNESINGHKLIKLFGGREHEIDRFSDVINKYRHYEMKFVYASAITSPAVQLIAVIALAAIVYIATDQAASNELSVGTFASFFTAMAMLLSPLKRLVRVNEHLQRGLAACETIFRLLDEPVEKDEGEISIHRLQGKIEFINVNFRYKSSDENVLTGLSFSIAAGQTVALVGTSGSGKTTIANLLPAFYRLHDGKILLDGIDINKIKLESLRNNISLVSQDIDLFNDTVRNNIAFGELKNSDENKIIEAAKAAFAYDFIMELPQGFETIIGEKGLKLSGGQRQRLTIARALLKEAPILILDEATSSLDAESERQIQEALEKLRQNSTCLVIAHRLSTVQTANLILLIEQGKLIEMGTHDELLNKGEEYSKLLKLQLINHN